MAEIRATAVVPVTAIGMVGTIPGAETVAATNKVPVYCPAAVMVTVCAGGCWFWPKSKLTADLSAVKTRDPDPPPPEPPPPVAACTVMVNPIVIELPIGCAQAESEQACNWIWPV